MLHGFLSYLVKCGLDGRRVSPSSATGGKQVRDNIHAADLAAACMSFHRAPRAAAVYNMGGGRVSNCSMLEAIEECERISGRELDRTLSDQARIGDHRWWISDLEEFRLDYPDWRITRDVTVILEEIHAENAERWTGAVA